MINWQYKFYYFCSTILINEIEFINGWTVFFPVQISTISHRPRFLIKVQITMRCHSIIYCFEIYLNSYQFAAFVQVFPFITIICRCVLVDKTMINLWFEIINFSTVIDLSLNIIDTFIFIFFFRQDTLT